VLDDPDVVEVSALGGGGRRVELFRSPEAETDPGDAETGNAFLFLTGFFYPRFLSFSISSAAVGCWRHGVLACSVGNLQGITVVW